MKSKIDSTWGLEQIYPNIKDVYLDLTNIKNLILQLEQKVEESIEEHQIPDLIKEYEKLLEKIRKAQSYITCILSIDSLNQEAQKIKGILYEINSSIHYLTIKLEEIIAKYNPSIEEYRFFILKCKENYEHRMTKEEEILYSKLSITSNSEWKSLYNELISNLKVEFEGNKISISELRKNYNSSNRNIREKTYETEIELFKEYEYIFSRILNSVKWDSIIVSQKRKFKSVLEQSLFHNQIDKEILDIVLSVAFENLSIVRRYFYKKAQLLDLEKLEWYDLSAPTEDHEKVEFDFDKAKEFILGNFAEFSQDMYNMALNAFEKNWIDYKPRIGKVSGGFCIYIHDKQSRILVNYDDSVNSLLVLAHELGHAYHNWLMSQNTFLYRSCPLIMAETASILAETITRNNTLKIFPNLKKQILDSYLHTISVVVVDILSRFLFEDKLINIRKERILTSQEICNLMLDSQQEIYLDSLNSFHPYMWITKPHYYSSNYYNYPYLLGLLIGLAIYNLYTIGQISNNQYVEILKNSGKGKPEEVLKSVGLDIRDSSFWQESFKQIEQIIVEFEKIE
ncbi:MAG: M3 family metallopeptidase [bacterium]